jgi:hypothetical protein
VAYEHEAYELSAEEERYETAYDLIETLRSVNVDFRLVDGKVRYRPVSRVNEHGRAELRRCKAEVYEILLEEEKIAARVEARRRAAPEVLQLPNDEYDELSELTADQQNALFGWIRESLEISPETTERYRHDSYELKHIFERAPEGFYVTDAQFRAVMWLAGFPGRRHHIFRLKAPESRYYYVRPNPAGLIRKLERAGVPYGWAIDAIMQAHPDEAA